VNTNSRAVEFGYEIRAAGDPKLLAEGSSKHMWLSRDWKPTRLPMEYQKILYAGANHDVNIEL
jgi:acyl-CoA thioesterase FadM